jgi:hypothetical protein
VEAPGGLGSQRRGLPKDKGTGWAYKFKNLNMKTALNNNNKPFPWISTTYPFNKTIERPLFSHQISWNYPFKAFSSGGQQNFIS